MTKKTIKCAECNTDYTYEPVKGYPDKRKYCANCSEKKKATWDAKSNGEPTATGNETFETVDMTSDSLEYEIRSREVRARALEAGISFGAIADVETIGDLMVMVENFERWILNGKE